ncbi:HAD family hydrolase [Schlesneria paludicola]|uniref:HAD family hydrolase n=1 Tax=Schlesneria paludicola TaxID=360056 RepID=UPI000299F72A|nr:HAD hydrolase-like protein [Schlesneria paludicola]
MPKTLLEYADWLAERKLLWPSAPSRETINATPSTKPVENIRAVTWSAYGTLLRIADGELLFQHPQTIRMEVAIDKTIHEFNMWNSMTRRPGKPSDSFLPKYRNALEDECLRSGNRKGDIPEVDSAHVWKKMLGLLNKKDYQYDESFYGELNAFSEKIAYFFHSSLQGVEALPHALSTLTILAGAGFRQAVLDNAQCFTLVQLTRALRAQGALADVRDLLPDSLNAMSYEWGIRKPSVSLYAQSILRFNQIGIEPNQVLHVGTRMQGDLAVAKSCGFRTVLYAGEKLSLQASLEELKNPAIRPDRLITDLIQLRDILQC